MSDEKIKAHVTDETFNENNLIDILNKMPSKEPVMLFKEFTVKGKKNVKKVFEILRNA